jgi:hypothetical protein
MPPLRRSRLLYSKLLYWPYARCCNQVTWLEVEQAWKMGEAGKSHKRYLACGPRETISRRNHRGMQAPEQQEYVLKMRSNFVSRSSPH